MPAAKTAEERREILERRIGLRVSEGWKLQARQEFTAQLVRHRGPGCLRLFMLALNLIVPAIVYLFVHEGDESIYLEVDSRGRISETRRGKAEPG